MTIRERFWIGLYLSSSSFWLLWLHKKLLVYLSFLLVVFYFIPLAFRNTQLFTLTGGEFLSYGIAFDMGFFVYIYLLAFFLVALIKHTLEIIHGNVGVSIRAIIVDTTKLWSQIFALSLLFMLMILVVQLVAVITNHLPALLSLLINFFIGAIFLGIVLMILPIIAVEKIGILKAIKKSMKLASLVFVEIIAALCWFAIIVGLGLTPILMIMNVTGSPYLAILLMWISIFGHYILHSALGITQALLYQRSIQLL